MKKAVTRMLWFLLSFTEEQKTGIKVKMRTEIDLSKVVPRDGKFHHLVATVEGWFMAKENGDDLTVQEIAVWKDGTRDGLKVRTGWTFEELKDNENL